MQSIPRFPRILLWATTALFAADPISADDDKLWAFVSGTVTAKLGSRSVDIERFDGSKFYLEGTKRPVRSWGGISGDFKPAISVSDLYAQVSNLEIKFSDSGASFGEVAAMNQAGALLMHAEFTPTPGVVSRGGRITIEGSTSTQVDEFHNAGLIAERLVTLQGDSSQSHQNRLLGQVKVKADLFSEQPIENAYAAVVMQFTRLFPEDELAHLPTLTRLVRVGDLKAGKPRKLKFTLTFPKLLAAESDLMVFLFEGSGKTVATNLSPDVRQLTQKEVKAMRESTQAPEKANNPAN